MDKVKNQHERDFYAEKAVENGWSRGVLVHQIESGLYKRQGKIQHNFSQTLPAGQSELARDLFKDPYKFDFLMLTEEAKERHLEKALVDHITRFMLEMGKGFAFVGKQVLLEKGGKDYYVDLLLYHLKLHCYVALELKIGDFIPEYTGKMNFYLSALDESYKTSEDKPSIGLILCKNKDKITVEYALRDVNKPIGVAAYQLTAAIPKELKCDLPSVEMLEKELRKEMSYLKSNEKKRELLNKLVAKLSPEELKREKSDQVVYELWRNTLNDLCHAIEEVFAPEKKLFNYVSVSKYVNGKYGDLLSFRQEQMKGEIKEIGLQLTMDNFKDAGSKAFSISKYLGIKLETAQYSVYYNNSKPWLSKNYYEKLSKEETTKISERLLNLALNEINKKLKEIVEGEH